MPTREEMIAALKGPNQGSVKPNRAEMIAALKGSESKTEAPEQGLGMKALDYVGRGLDYVGGLTRTGAAQIADTFTDENEIGSQDFYAALKGKAPSSEEIMGRFDVPEGASVNLPFIGETSVRDVGGFALDVGLDPLTYLSLGTAAAAKTAAKGGLKAMAQKGARLAAKPTAKAGEKLFKSGLKKVDEKLMEKGKTKLFSDIMLEKGISGTNKTIEKKATKLADDLLDQRKTLFQSLDQAGAKVDVENIFDKVIENNDKLRKTPGFKKVADDLDEKALEFMSAGPVDITTASRAKSMLYDALPQSAYDSFGGVKKPAQKFVKDTAKAFKEAIEKSADEVAQGTGNQIKKINEDLGGLLTSQKPLSREVAKGNTKNAITSIDSALASVNPAMAAAKKAGDLSKTTYVRTKAGKGLKDLGESGIADILLRSAIIDRQQPTESPWARMRK